MKMIVGLGNIGSKYAGTRHNTGFMAVEAFCEKNGIKLSQQKMDAIYGTGIVDGEKVMVVEPTTFMNESGRAVGPLMKFYKLNLDDLVVVYDDMDLHVGRIRLRNHGSAGGHNGIKSLIAHLGTDKFNRIKIGTDHPKHDSVVNYVLSKFSLEQQGPLAEALDKTVNALDEWVAGTDSQKLENEYN
ncbi:aminoacyl-tRNA hydrolase [Fructilactobacillus lindneri]|uniref:Peptidyl-tRNA hydrolase n=2 Tax=Fructilactobacillus lindneri TaxID=53444 RepID=A0A0R2JUI0_9LACO|nr:aminoacyl-tRNA hydrolase [Fructilactobacillus lindneri]ANZ57328.1 aminoacyl-tRNA hydrolase [Fructilactobacillus lindneri]ANZ58593.1 aminoacyl-tRNA hydrolase [Fructilactobacillus lindneri]KRN80736.1 peptidyl-tRNA hydrolase [Fructilactobacillus lindneri DSM 20690 = JCM 11027]POG97631.1 aminoacyl-tRNA hydrolase [Fructilactobacillus lindneri]POG98968.1 aminoacyl-tRNA hydrolase [Fructilactobacillus lindneri]